MVHSKHRMSIHQSLKQKNIKMPRLFEPLKSLYYIRFYSQTDKAYMKGRLSMKNMFKRSLAAVMAVASLAVGMVGMSASAATTTTKNSYSFWLERDQGAPSGSESLYRTWDYTTTGTSIEFKITTFTRSTPSSYSYVSCYAKVDGVVKINASLATANSLSATVVKGRNGSASVTLQNYASGSHTATGNFYF